MPARPDRRIVGLSGRVETVFWTVGGTDPDSYQRARTSRRLSELPTNHNLRFAPALHSTLETGIEATVTATEA
jgi:hippurate hydrolase